MPRKEKTNDQDLNKRLVKRIFAIVLIGATSVLTMLKFGPMIGSLFGMISVNRGQIISPPEANLPPPIFVDTPKAVNETKVNIKGVSAPKTRIELFVNGPKVDSVLTDTSGEFLFTDVKLNKGTNTVFAKAEGTKSEVIKIAYDDDAPEIEIEAPENGETVENLNERIEVRGTINEEAEIRINDRVAIQKPDNSFSFLLGVGEGDVEIKVAATDLAGNKAEEELKVKYRRD